MAGEERNIKVKIDGVKKIFNGRSGEMVALNGINMDILDNEFVCVVGPSGCGKSTLLNIIAGLMEPTSGNVYVDGKKVQGTGVERGVVFQQYALFPWLTVKKNVEFGLKLKNLPKDEIEEIAMKYIRMVDLEKFVNAYPKEETVERVALNVAYMPNYASMWVLMAAKEGGYFDEEGLDVTLFEFADGPTEIASMESGSIDLAYIGDGAHKLAANNNCKIFCYSHIGDAEMVIGRTSAGINSLEDLAGKTVGYASGTSSETMLQRALEDAGLTMDDIIPYDMDTNNMVTAMVSGTLDACSTWSPNTWQILNELDDAERLCSPADYSDKYVALSSFVVMENWMNENHDVLIRFTRALMKAMDYAALDENLGQVSEWVATQLASDVDTVELQCHDGSWLTGQELYEAVKDGTIEGYYQLQLDQMIVNGTAPEGTNVSDYVMFDVMLEAGESLYGE